MATLYEMPMVFHSEGTPLIGRLYRNTPDLNTRQPAVVVTGSWLTVKEQMPAVYAKRLAGLGYTAFTFDFAGFGESQGTPRQCEMPLRKIADIKAAAHFMHTQSFTQAGRVGHLANCASAQFTLAAIADGAPIASFASVAGWFHDANSVAPFYGAAEGVRLRLGRAQAAIERFIATGETVMAPAYRAGDDRAAMFFPLDYYERRERGVVPAWKNEMAEMTWAYWLTFDGMKAAASAMAPALFVHSDGCAFPDHVKQIHATLRGKKRLVWTQGNQVDFYDLPDHVDRAMAAVEPWFKETLQA